MQLVHAGVKRYIRFCYYYYAYYHVLLQGIHILFSLPENTFGGTAILTVHAEDIDSGDNGHVRYEMRYKVSESNNVGYLYFEVLRLRRFTSLPYEYQCNINAISMQYQCSVSHRRTGDANMKS